FDGGRSSLKLYFMNGLPTETDEDIKGIASLGQSIVDKYYSKKRFGGGRGVNVTISVSCLVPKPFTPFQWAAQDTIEELERKQQLLKSEIKTKKISYKYHDARVSRIEAVFARGDRKLCKAMLEAYNREMMLDGWDEYFSYDKWIDLFNDCGIDPAFYANREYSVDEILPWDFIDIGVTKKFMKNEYEKSKNAVTTPDCKTKCSGCGASSLCNGKCVCDGGKENA
ncbi:MAG: B12-binding domain-containing radical SAM protein, partial [Clostridia bacterium]|nr:B12-binding domain-containing radical SAM protein [Clostridia bacterium]